MPRPQQNAAVIAVLRRDFRPFDGPILKRCVGRRLFWFHFSSLVLFFSPMSINNRHDQSMIIVSREPRRGTARLADEFRIGQLGRGSLRARGACAAPSSGGADHFRTDAALRWCDAGDLAFRS